MRSFLRGMPVGLSTRLWLCLLMLLFVLPALTAPASASTGSPPIKHVFVIVLENENADTTFGPGSPAPYLSTR